MARRTFIDLFCGAGGATEGFRSAGFRQLLAIDCDPVAIETYRLNHPRARTICDDIRNLNPAELAERSPNLLGADVLIACPPCQGFSTIRTRRRETATDVRNELIFEVARFAEELEPKAVVVENVPGLEKDDRLAELLNRLGTLGYNMVALRLDAADYGVPQRRQRLVAVGVRGGFNLLGHPLKSRRRTVRSAIGHLPAVSSNLSDPLHESSVARSPRVEALIRAIPKDGGSRHALPPDMQLDCHRRVKGFWDVYGRMSWDDVAPTITGGCINPSKGRFLHPIEDRAITLREAALLQTFPLGYRFSLVRGRYKVAEMIGNAVPPRLARAQGRHIAMTLDAIALKTGAG